MGLFKEEMTVLPVIKLGLQGEEKGEEKGLDHERRKRW